MARLEIFEPAMCCPSGVCGTNIDQGLVQFAADLEWIRSRGVEVERYNLAQQPDKFVQSGPVKNAMALAGDKCLPIILANGRIVAQNTYPDRSSLARLAGLTTE
ncbi:MAG: arsenite efflux transporter metallochaperone ArsD [Deltaproteobacteria bacterium]|nr:arsenite efflux transporter metallochaperone ArsD [Deltaproteobacteria bacterium]